MFIDKRGRRREKRPNKASKVIFRDCFIGLNLRAQNREGKKKKILLFLKKKKDNESKTT